MATVTALETTNRDTELWTVIMPLSELGHAKSRLVAASPDVDQHRRLVSAMRADALRACLASRWVHRVVLVTDDSTAAAAASARVQVLPDPPGRDLNAAVRAGADEARRGGAGDVIALVSDLPCLSAQVLDDVLGGTVPPRALVSDRDGRGTTALLARAGFALDPQFGAGSARRHLASGAVGLDASPRLRCDVDAPEDLAAAIALGVGPSTAAELRRRRGSAPQ